MTYFTIKELSHSNTAVSKGIDNTPTAAVEENLTRLVDAILDPLRAAYGKPIKVNSGYRSPALNTAINGAKSSQHMTGEAADITAGNAVENEKLYNLIISLKLPFDQLIDESNFSWVHVSHKASGNRGQLLKL